MNTLSTNNRRFAFAKQILDKTPVPRRVLDTLISASLASYCASYQKVLAWETVNSVYSFVYLKRELDFKETLTHNVATTLLIDLTDSEIETLSNYRKRNLLHLALENKLLDAYLSHKNQVRTNMVHYAYQQSSSVSLDVLQALSLFLPHQKPIRH